MRTPRSAEQLRLDFFSRVRKLKGRNACWVWTGCATDRGYGRVWANGKTLRAHRVAYKYEHSTCPKLVRHSCDNPICVRPSHLLEGTPKQNMADKYRRGRAVHHRGEAAGTAKLTEIKVRWIRKTYADGKANMPQMSAQLGVCRQTICDVIHKKTWAHL